MEPIGVLTYSHLTARIAAWVISRFGRAVLMDRHERAMRVLEEAIELAQAERVTPEEVERVVRRVFSQPVGDPEQEAAGVSVCLRAWTYAAGSDLNYITDREVSRIENVPIEVTRAKQNAKADAGTALRAKS